MQHLTLPDDIRGEWIWSPSAADRIEDYLFLRREFTLSETPAAAELWLSARTMAHVYVNGRYLGFGPGPAAGRDSLFLYFDIGFLTETGRNVIAVLAHNTRVARYAACRRQGGLWAQLDIDGKPALWTDRRWVVRPADCYDRNRPRLSTSAGFSEKIDLRYYPHGWEAPEFTSIRWQAPTRTLSLGRAGGKLLPPAIPEWQAEAVAPRSVARRGRWESARAMTCVTFAKLAADRGAGVYIAESWLHSDTDAELEFELYCDDPYALFVNGACVKEQGRDALPLVADLVRARPPCFRQCEQADPDGSLPVLTGWNRLLVAQQVAVDSAGLSMVLSELEHDKLHLFRSPREDRERQRGWSLSGPLRTPLPRVTGNLDTAPLPAVALVPAIRDPVDEAAYHMSCVFRALPGADAEGDSAPALPLELRQGDYVILDFGTVLFGCPQLQLDGTDEDVVDLVWGDRIVADQLLAFYDGRRHLDTATLGIRSCCWTACNPRGLRYLMIAVRRAAATVNVRECRMLTQRYTFPAAGHFECSDPVLTRIWEVGCHTLRACIQGRFLESPVKENAQYIGDALIESWAGYHVFGTYALAGRAIAEFADHQFETGEMPVLSPSDFHLSMPDFALLWPVWLHRHYLYSGDRSLVESLRPHLETFFAYWQGAELPGFELLGNLGERFGAYCFLDHGDIDRQGIVTGLNAIYCRALLSGAWLFEQLDAKPRAQGLRRRAARAATRLRELAWDPQQALFADSWHQGEMSEFCSWQTNVLALYGGVAAAADYERIFTKLFNATEPFEPFAAGDKNNPYFKYFVIEAACALQRREWAALALRHYWGAMLAHGAETWWELFDPDGHAQDRRTCSTCHGYGTSPNGFLIAELVGLRPARPGFSCAYFNPMPLPGLVRRAAAQIPTPSGRVNVEWETDEKGTFEASIAASFPLEVIPVFSPAIAASAVLHVNDEVHILTAPPGPAGA